MECVTRAAAAVTRRRLPPIVGSWAAGSGPPYGLPVLQPVRPSRRQPGTRTSRERRGGVSRTERGLPWPPSPYSHSRNWPGRPGSGCSLEVSALAGRDRGRDRLRPEPAAVAGHGPGLPKLRPEARCPAVRAELPGQVPVDGGAGNAEGFGDLGGAFALGVPCLGRGERVGVHDSGPAPSSSFGARRGRSVVIPGQACVLSRRAGRQTLAAVVPLLAAAPRRSMPGSRRGRRPPSGTAARRCGRAAHQAPLRKSPQRGRRPWRAGRRARPRARGARPLRRLPRLRSARASLRAAALSP